MTTTPWGMISKAIAFARETWRNDGAEGQTVHLLAAELEWRGGCLRAIDLLGEATARGALDVGALTSAIQVLAQGRATDNDGDSIAAEVMRAIIRAGGPRTWADLAADMVNAIGREKAAELVGAALDAGEIGEAVAKLPPLDVAALSRRALAEELPLEDVIRDAFERGVKAHARSRVLAGDRSRDAIARVGALDGWAVGDDGEKFCAVGPWRDDSEAAHQDADLGADALKVRGALVAVYLEAEKPEATVASLRAIAQEGIGLAPGGELAGATGAPGATGATGGTGP